jgi:hypothetical protein
MVPKVIKLLAASVVALSTIGCQSTTSASGDELRLLTSEQETKLLEQAERVEPTAPVTEYVRNSKGDVVGTVTSQTTVIFLKTGGRFSVNTTCTSTCGGVPVTICPSGSNSCGCDSKCKTCAGCSDSQGCTGSCTQSKVGFGNFGRFIF